MIKMMKQARFLSLSLFATAVLANDENNPQLLRGSITSHSAMHVFNKWDPKTIEMKKNASSVWSALTTEEMPRPLNILSFGTSQTFGHGLEDRNTQSYPYLITPYISHVDNLGLPATAADHPSLCLESMIPDSATKNYDVITFEYTFNQSDGSTLLLRRLRERYPEAIIIFVNVWNLVSKAVVKETNKGPRSGGGFDINQNWVWKDAHDTFSVNPASFERAQLCNAELCHLNNVMALLEEVDGVFFKLPRPDDPRDVMGGDWFQADWHHLSAKGHKIVAVGLAALLRSGKRKGHSLWEQAFKDNKTLGSWRGGDICYNWHFNGQIAPQVKYEGAHLVYEAHEDYYTLAVESSGATITFESDYEYEVPVAIVYLGQGYPDIYPTVEVTLNGSTPPVIVDPDLTRGNRGNRMKPSAAKISSYSNIGNAKPGLNRIQVKPIEVKDSPLLLLGLYLCGACQHFHNGHMGYGDLSMDHHEDGFDKIKMKNLLGYGTAKPLS